MKIISKCIFSLILFSSFNMTLYAENISIQQSEQVIILKYAALDFYEVNQKIEQDIVDLIQKNTASYAYSFPKLTENLRLKINSSPDRLLKFYTFDVGGGGTMGEFSSYVQMKSRPSSKLQAINTGYILNIDQVKMGTQPIYLVQSYYKGDSCHGLYQIQAFKMHAQALTPAPIFQTKNKKQLSSIEVDYDCHYDEARQGSYIRVSKDLKYVDIKLLNQNSQPTGQYLRYTRGKSAYQYQGVVN